MRKLKILFILIFFYSLIFTGCLSVDKRPPSVKTKNNETLTDYNQSLLKQIEWLINDNPQIGITVKDFQQYENEKLDALKDQLRSEHEIIEEQIKLRRKFIDFLRNKLKENDQ
jgi:hypothetical protein